MSMIQSPMPSRPSSPLCGEFLEEQSQLIASETRRAPSERDLYDAVLLGQEALEAFLSRYPDTAAKYSADKKTVLHFAAKKGNELAVGILVRKGAPLNAQDRQGNTPLMDAVKSGEIAVVKKLLPEDLSQKKAPIHQKNKRGATALHIAAREGNSPIIGYLLKLGARIEEEDGKGNTPLALAARCNHIGAVKLLLEQRACENAPNHKGDTPLHQAAKRGHEDVVSCLLGRWSIEKDARNRQGCTALLVSLIGKEICPSVVKILLKAGAKPAIQNEKGETALHYAARRGARSAAHYLIKKQRHIDIKDYTGATAIHWAAWAGHRDMIEFLKENEANLYEITREGETVLHFAALSGSRKCLQYAVEQGVEINAVDKDGNTSLHVGAKYGQTESIECLLERGAEPHRLNHAMKTPLHYAAEEGHDDVVAVLVEQKDEIDSLSKNISLQDENGDTPLHLATRNRHLTSVDHLLAADAEPCLSNQAQQMPLHIAACDNTGDAAVDEIASLLLRQGPEAVNRGISYAIQLSSHYGSISLQIAQGVTPLHLAAQAGNENLVHLLLAHGANPAALNSLGQAPYAMATEEMRTFLEEKCMKSRQCSCVIL